MEEKTFYAKKDYKKESIEKKCSGLMDGMHIDLSGCNRILPVKTDGTTWNVGDYVDKDIENGIYELYDYDIVVWDGYVSEKHAKTHKNKSDKEAELLEMLEKVVKEREEAENKTIELKESLLKLKESHNCLKFSLDMSNERYKSLVEALNLIINLAENK